MFVKIVTHIIMCRNSMTGSIHYEELKRACESQKKIGNV